MKKLPIIILHGWGLSGSRFAPLVDLLSRAGYSPYAPDFPGFGTSEIPKSAYTLADYSNFLADYITKHTIQRPILIGHSFGGRVALKFQSMYPSVARALILTGTPGYTPVPRKKLMMFVAVAKIGRKIFELPVLRIVQDSVRKWYYYVVGAREFYRADGVMREVFKNVVAEGLEPYMSSVNIPCFLVWGELDRITPVWIAQKMQKVIKGSTLLIIPDTDHGISFKEPALFYKAITNFLRSV